MENKFIELSRVCVPLGVACNLKCKYCYREWNKPKIPAFNSLMHEFLQTLNPSKTHAVVASGGEPFLYMDKIKELFQYAKPKIHKKIMTSGVYLTQEYVDWINKNKIEIHLSYDGKVSKYLRGVDILEDDKLLSLIKQIECLRINSVITKYNTNCLDIYKHIVRKLKRDDFRYTPNVVYSINNEDLIKDFNIKEYVETWNAVYEITPRYWAYNRNGEKPSLGLNILPNGDVVDMGYLHKYGTVLDKYESIKEKVLKEKCVRYCINKDCKIRDRCNRFVTLATPFNCSILEEIYEYTKRSCT